MNTSGWSDKEVSELSEEAILDQIRMHEESIRHDVNSVKFWTELHYRWHQLKAASKGE